MIILCPGQRPVCAARTAVVDMVACHSPWTSYWTIRKIQDWMEPVDFGRAMTFDPERLLKEPPIETIAEHNLRDVILYALGVGVGVETATRMDTIAFA